MSAFHLRDSLTDPGFTNRVDSVFAALGSGSVKAPEDGGGSGFDRNQTPNFEQDQFNRSIKCRESNPKRCKFDSDLDFKHPAEFLRPESRDRSPRGRGGGNVARGSVNRGERGGGEGSNRGGNRGGRGRGHVPDYKKNPANWKKYSLADVESVTDRSNSAAAFTFLKSIKSGNKSDSDNEETSCSMDTSEKLVFKKPSRKKADLKVTSAADEINEPNTSTENEMEHNEAEASSSVDNEPELAKEPKAKFVGSLNVMPECVVGAKPTNKDRNKKVKEKSKMKDKLVLSHLQDEEDDE